MNLDGTYLSEKSRLEVARAYISHELKKVDLAAVEKTAEIIANRTTAKHAAIFRDMWPRLARKDGRPDTLLLDTPCLDLWYLFHAISCGRREKELYNCVGHPNFTWYLQPVCRDRIDLETKVGILKCAGGNISPMPFQTALDYARTLDKCILEQSLKCYDSASEQDRTSDPLIGRLLGNHRVLVHDGNGRVTFICALVALGQDAPREVRIWVGTEGTRDPKKYTLYQKCLSSVFATSS